jgi:hypothetical protein
MPRRVVKQPNGLFGYFSTILDDFTHVNMTVKEMFDVCRMEMEPHEAIEKVHRGIVDAPIWGNEPPDPDGLMRWKHDLRAIVFAHGAKVARQRKEECSTPNPPRKGAI